jgi:serine/threonine protein phosphatase 1
VNAHGADDGALHIFISDWEPAPGRLPPGTSAWAIGDVHGQLDLLNALLTAVETEVAAAPPGPRHLILLGDYIDRGPENIAALERAANVDIPGVTVTALMGNHEEILDEFLNGERIDWDFLDSWAMNGGQSTLANLGVGPGDLRRLTASALTDQVRQRAPESVRHALATLQIGLRLGDYLFVHAGVHPRHALEDDARQRLTTIREPFLTGKGWIHDFAVVHGHSIIGPDIARHRIAVDSGAFMTGILSCVELSGDEARFIVASRAPDLDALRRIPGRRALSGERWRRQASLRRAGASGRATPMLSATSLSPIHAGL